MSVCVVPAAGSSRRMRRSKALLPWRGTTIVEALISALSRGGVERVVVVTRPDDVQLRHLVAAVTGVTVAVNPQPADGMLSSILAGLDAVLDGPQYSVSALLVCPVDHPLVSAETVAQLLQRHQVSKRDILVPTHRCRRGHPILIPWALATEIRGLDPERGLRQLLDARAPEVVEVPVQDRGVVANLNTLEDYESAIRLLAT